MNQEERQLITELFDRMRGFGKPEKDRDADSLIAQSVRANPDASYMLVQSVLVQDNALKMADQRIQDLEAHVQDLEAQASKSQAAPQSGGFLGGLFGGSRPAASVPTAGRGYAQQPAASPGGPWGGRQAAAPAQMAPMQAAPAAASGGGGFMKTAMATAAGVAGGMMAASAIQNMMGGNHGHGHDTASRGGEMGGGTGVDSPGLRPEPAYQSADDNDPASQEQQDAYEDSHDTGGSSDFET